MPNIESTLAGALLFVCVLGCGSRNAADVGELAPPIESSEPEVGQVVANSSVDNSVLVTTDQKEAVEEIDADTVSKVNDGFKVDMDDDGLVDQVIMEFAELFFQKGLGEERYGPKQRIARVEEEIVAYNIKAAPEAGIERPSFFIYKKVPGQDLLQGFVQKNLGTDSEGQIILAEPESFSEDAFDF